MKDTHNGIAFGLAALGLSLAACGGSGSQAQETTPAAPAAPAAAPTPAAEAAGPAHLKFAEMTISEGTNAIFKIHADGKTEVAGPGGTWSEGPAVTADGTISFKQQKVAKVEADGTIKNLRNGQVLPVKIGTDTLTATMPGGEMVLQIKEDGSIPIAGAPPEKNLKVDGAADAENRRTALALIGAIFLSGKASSEPAQPAQPAQPAPGATPAPAPAPQPATPPKPPK
jgi:hypothetical protein